MRQLLVWALVALSLEALAAPLQTIALDVQNMNCELCPVTVKKSLERVAGVSAVTIDWQEDRHRDLRS